MIPTPSFGTAFGRFLIQLRIRFIAVLAPIFLWGAFVHDPAAFPGVRFWVAFALYNVCLYGGVNALNTYYDKSTGPIGGLKKPPAVDPSLLGLAWGIQIVGAVVAAAMGLPAAFIAIYAIFMALSVAYSHPAVRLKGSPIGSAAVVAIGQGFLTYAAGWLAAGGALGDVLGGTPLLGGIAVSALALGMYPLTQLYQLEDDAKAGDRTLSRALGVKGSFAFSLGLLAVSGAALIAVLYRLEGQLDALLVGAFWLGHLVHIWWWGRNFEGGAWERNYAKVMGTNYVDAAVFATYIVGRWLN